MEGKRFVGKALSGCAAACIILSGLAMAQPYPAKPIRMLVSFGGGGENNARIIAERAAERRIAQVGTTINTKPSEEFAVSIKQDFELAGRLIKASGVEPE